MDDKRVTRTPTTAINEWGFIGQDIMVALGMSATIYKFKQRCGLVLDERILLSISHSS